jgi:Zn-dependent M28 family amino/carboxypeptidase
MRANTDRIYKDVAFLTTIEPARNFRRPESLEKTYRYIEGELAKAGAITKLQNWNVAGIGYTNVIARYNGDKKKRVIVGAHYDVCGDQPGADDNASGVAGLLEIARLLFTNMPKTEYSVEMVAYCLEEPPYFGSKDMGSYIHAKSLFEEKADVIGMICLEMIGYYSEVPGSQPFPSPELAKLYPDTANFIIVVGIEKFSSFSSQVHGLMATGSDIDVQLIHFPSAEGLAGLSDHRNYWEFGYNALMVNDTAFVRNPNYHSPTDTINTLDFKKMAAVVDSVYRAITGMD